MWLLQKTVQKKKLKLKLFVGVLHLPFLSSALFHLSRAALLLGCIRWIMILDPASSRYLWNAPPCHIFEQNQKMMIYELNRKCYSIWKETLDRRIWNNILTCHANWWIPSKHGNRLVSVSSYCVFPVAPLLLGPLHIFQTLAFAHVTSTASTEDRRQFYEAPFPMY